jgi:hypothetical protein
MICERCNLDPDTIPEECRLPEDEVKLEDSCTAYHWDGKGLDPNRPIALCRKCAVDHHEYWNEQWNEYYQMIYG